MESANMIEEEANNSGPSIFNEYEQILIREVEASKFQKHGKYIAERLKTELGRGRKSTRLHDYQIDAVLKVGKHFKQHIGVDQPMMPALITAPPGSGKSGMVTLLPYVLLSEKVLIVTPGVVISDQIAEAFGFPIITGSFFMKSGMFQEPSALKKLLEVPHKAKNQEDVKNMTFHSLVIVNAQKFSGKSSTSLTSSNNQVKQEMTDRLNEFDTVIVDEAHHYPAQTWINILSHFEGKKVVFFTATPFRGSGKNCVYIKDLVGINIKEVYSIQRSKLENTTIRRLEFIENPGPVASLSDTDFLELLNANITEQLNKHKAMEPRLTLPQALVMVRTKVEALELSIALGQNTATYVYSGPVGQRNLKDFTDGKKQIAVVCGMLREGYDNLNVTLCVILFKCGSRVWFEQFCGRCMRMNRNLTGKKPDQTVGTVLSYKTFDQQKMWDIREQIAEEDPQEEVLGDE